jgi:hypothetical protein
VSYDKLGLKKEDEKENKAREDNRSKSSWNDKDVEEHSCGDELLDGSGFLGNWKEPVMNLGTRYKDIVTFRLAMRQYAIKKEFELGIEATDQTRYRAFCQGEACPWKIHARVEIKGSPTVIVSIFLAHYVCSVVGCSNFMALILLQVIALTDEHTCTSSGRRKTATPTSAWVASLAAPILKKKQHMGAKELQTTLQDTHNCI